VRYTRIVTTAGGGSAFIEAELETVVASVVAGGPTRVLSVPLATLHAQFVDIGAEAGMSGTHNAPRRQFVLVLSGRLGVETSDGERREFGPGDITLWHRAPGGFLRRERPSVGDYVAVTATRGGATAAVGAFMFPTLDHAAPPPGSCSS
jgi:hypothetical protein